MPDREAVTTKLGVQDLLSELRADVASGKSIPALAAGLSSGLSLLVAYVAFGTAIYSGPLAPYSSQGVGLVLFGTFASCLIFAFTGGYRGVVAGLSPALVIVMASVATTVDARGEALFVTAAGALIISAVGTGACCLLIGWFKLANLVRFIPYPVAGGFVAGIGGAVCLAAMALMGARLHWQSLPALVEPSVLWIWLPGAAFGIGLYLLMKRLRHALVLPVAVALAVGAHHLAFAALGLSGEEARAAGLLLTGTAGGRLWPALGPGDVALVDWAAMAGQAPEMLILVLIAFICIIMNVAGLEIAVDRELDWDGEFKATGVASLVSGLGGGTVATVVVPASLRSKLFGAATRLTGVTTAAVIGSALFLGDGMLEIVPTAIVGGILFFAGLGMLDEGLVRSRRRLPASEFGIILLIFMVIITLGLFEGVAAGMLAMLVFFAVRLSRVDPIEARFTARERRSNKVRSIPQRAILLAEGERVHAYRLRGYIFFGSAIPLTDRLKESLNGPSPPSSLMLDFTAVSGFDFSAVNTLSRFLQAAHAAGARLVLSGVSETLRFGLERNLPPAVFAGLLFEADVERALDHCEEIVIEAWNADETTPDARRASLLERTADDVERYLKRQIQFEDLTEELGRWLTPRAHGARDPLAGPDAPQDGLQLLLSGRASAYDDTGARLHQFSPGDAIWPDEAALVVLADEPCTTMVLTPATRGWLEEHEQGVALNLYRYLLAGRLEVESGAGMARKAADADEESV